MMTSPNTISDLIGKWGTIRKFSNEVGCGYEAARKMRDRESIDPKHWESIVAAARRRGIKGVTEKWLISQRSRKECA